MNVTSFSQHCFHCDEPFEHESEIVSFQDANCFPLSKEFYNGEYEGKRFRLVCQTCTDQEDFWFLQQMSERLSEWREGGEN